jgi:hypothetical protein
MCLALHAGLTEFLCEPIDQRLGFRSRAKMRRNPEHYLERTRYEAERRYELAGAKIVQHENFRHHGDTETACGRLYQQIEMIVKSLWPQFVGLSRYLCPIRPPVWTRLGCQEGASI